MTRTNTSKQAPLASVESVGERVLRAHAGDPRDPHIRRALELQHWLNVAIHTVVVPSSSCEHIDETKARAKIDALYETLKGMNLERIWRRDLYRLLESEAFVTRLRAREGKPESLEQFATVVAARDWILGRAALSSDERAKLCRIAVARVREAHVFVRLLDDPETSAAVDQGVRRSLAHVKRQLDALVAVELRKMPQIWRARAGLAPPNAKDLSDECLREITKSLLEEELSVETLAELAELETRRELCSMRLAKVLACWHDSNERGTKKRGKWKLLVELLEHAGAPPPKGSSWKSDNDPWNRVKCDFKETRKLDRLLDEQHAALQTMA